MTKLNDNQNDKTNAADLFETVEPIGMRVLIRKDEDKKQTKGGDPTA